MNSSPTNCFSENIPCSVSSYSQRNYHTLVVGVLNNRQTPPYSQCSQSSGSRGSSLEVLPKPLPFSSENINEDETTHGANRADYYPKTAPPSYIANQGELESFSTSVEEIPYYPHSTTDVSASSVNYQKESLRTFFFYTLFSIFIKIFLFAFYVGNIIFSSLSITKCPYQVANLSHFLPLAMLFINSIGLFHLIFHVFIGWISICSSLDSKFINSHSITNKINCTLQGFQIFEIVGLLPLASFFLCSLLYVFLHSTPNLQCTTCTSYCEESFYRFSSSSMEFYAIFVFTFTLVNLYLACVKYCLPALLEVKDVHFYSQEKNQS